jgi:hypothetical protein
MPEPRGFLRTSRLLKNNSPPPTSAAARLRNQAEIPELRDQKNDRSAHVTELNQLDAYSFEPERIGELSDLVEKRRGGAMTEVIPEAPLAASDRSRLYAFLIATDASATALERPVCRVWVGDCQITGKSGHVLANGAGYLLYVHIDERTAMEREPSSRPWKNAKARLTFCKVTQDGDWEGCLYLDRLPTADEAVVIREVLGIRKRRHMTAEALSKLERTRRFIKSPDLDRDLAHGHSDC